MPHATPEKRAEYRQRVRERVNAQKRARYAAAPEVARERAAARYTPRPRQRTTADCSFADCGRVVKARGYCGAHYAQQQRGKPLVPIKAPSTAAGRWVVRGYVYVYDPAARRTRPEHQLVMEAVLGRPLAKGENVHHINGVRDDNRPENLELWTRPQPSGVRAADQHCPSCSCSLDYAV